MAHARLRRDCGCGGTAAAARLWHACTMAGCTAHRHLTRLRSTYDPRLHAVVVQADLSHTVGASTAAAARSAQGDTFSYRARDHSLAERERSVAEREAADDRGCRIPTRPRCLPLDDSGRRGPTPRDEDAEGVLGQRGHLRRQVYKYDCG